MKEKTKIVPMTVPVALETCALIGKQLNKYAIMVATIGSEGDRVLKREMIVKLATSILENESDLSDIKKIIANLLGRKVEEFVLGEIANDLREAWNVNRMDKLIALCQELGIYTKQDIANFAWVLVNWTNG